MTRKQDSSATFVERHKVDWNDDDQILDFIYSRLEQKDYYKGGQEQEWLKIISVYEGQPYHKFDETLRILREDLHVPSWRVNLIVNLLLPKVRLHVSKHLRNRPIWDVLPATADVADVNRAQKSKKVLQGFWFNQQLDYQFIDLLLWIGLTGNGFAEVSWNPDIGPDYEVSIQDFIDQTIPSELTTEFISEQQKLELILADAQSKFNNFVKRNGGAIYPLGEVELSIISPFDMIFPHVQMFSKAPWVIKTLVRDRAYYADLGIDPDEFTGPTERETRYLFYARRIYNIFNASSSGGISKDDDVLECHLWLPKSRQFRQGFHVVATRNKVIFKGENPYNHRSIPIVHFSAEHVPGRTWGFSAAKIATPIIEQYQKSRSQLVEIKNLMSKPKWVVPRTARIEETAITSEPGEVIEYSGINAPSVIQPPQVPGYLGTLLELDRRDLDDIMASHDASSGINPSGSRSGLMNINLQEQDDGQLSLIGLNLDTGFSKLGGLVLSVMDQFYTEERIVKYVGEKGRFEVMQLVPGEITGKSKAVGVDYFGVRVTQFSQFGLSRGGQLEFLKVLLQYGIFKDTERDKIMKFINLGWLEDQLDEFQIDRSNAYKENLLLSQGQYIPPDISDRDLTHIEEHTRYQKDPIFRDAPPEIRSLLQRHVQEHKLFLVMKEIEPQLLVIPAQYLAATLNNIPLEALQGASNGRELGRKERNEGRNNSSLVGNV